MKFLVDIPLSPALAEWLTRQGHDAVHGSTVGLQRASDEEIIVVARAEKRIIVTADLDYPRLLSIEQAISPGLILFRGGQFSEGETVSRLRQVLSLLTDTELDNSLVVIEPHRVRKRSLPITS